ncbi:MAG TPA: heme biosynthesis HemY N-terminal domain-containing protein, partial [Pseudomonadales bacterium]|nr:heme biosynthesis HemY N-terminal domain-containing protein [Pseudomonadales bacterium]
MKRIMNLFLIRPVSFIIVVTSLLVGATLPLFSNNSGYLLLSFGNYVVETTLLVGLSIIALLVIALSSLTGFFQFVFDPDRKRRMANKVTVRGLINLNEGHWEKAESQLSAAVVGTDTPLLNWLAAARAANEQGRYKESDEYLKKAHEQTPGAALAIGLTQAELQLQRGQLEESYASLNKLREQYKKNDHVLRLLLEVLTKLEDWKALRELLPEFQKRDLINQEQAARLEQQAISGELERIKKSSLTSSDLRSDIMGFWHALDSKAQKIPALALDVAQTLINANDDDAAEQILQSTLNSVWNESLVELIGKLKTSDPARTLLSAEKWLQERPSDPILLFSLGRLAWHADDDEKARAYLEASVKLKKSLENCHALGQLMA